jgi:hypothetical protein
MKMKIARFTCGMALLGAVWSSTPLAAQMDISRHCDRKLKDETLPGALA